MNYIIKFLCLLECREITMSIEKSTLPPAKKKKERKEYQVWIKKHRRLVFQVFVYIIFSAKLKN